MNLEKNQLWTLWFGLGLFIAAFIWDGAFSLGNNTERYRNLLEKNLHQQERDAEAVLSDNAFVERRLTDKFTGTDFKADTARLDKLRDKPFNICFFKNDSLVFWTKNDVLPTKTDFGDDTIIGKTHTRLVEIQGSQFELRSRRSARPDGSRLTVAALIPIRRNYNSFEGKFLENRFIASTLISSELSLMPTDATHVQMLTYEGHALCSLQFKKNTDSIHDIGMLCLLVAGFLMLGFFGDRLAKQMLNEYESPMLGVSFFIGTLVVLRGCIWHIESSQFFPTTDLNTNDFQNATFMHSISALFINSVFLFWLAIFFNKEFRLPDFKQHPLWARGILAVGLFSIAVILNILSIGIFNDIVATPTKEPALAFDNLNALNLRSTFTLCGLGLMQLSIFLITHRLIKSATELELTH